MKLVFSNIYNKNIWGNGSGDGSELNYNKEYINFLENFIKDKEIKTVLDLGCGDWQFSQFIDWSKVNYTGIDCVESVINNNLKFESGNIKFICREFHTGEDLPDSDLIIIKDVLQHWSINTIIEFLPKLSKYKHVLIINCITSNNFYNLYFNKDISDGGFRPLDVNLEPFNFNGQCLFTYDTKSVIYKLNL